MCSFGSCQMHFEFISQFRKVRNAFECFVTQVQTRLPKTKRVWPMKINVICTVHCWTCLNRFMVKPVFKGHSDERATWDDGFIFQNSVISSTLKYQWIQDTSHIYIRTLTMGYCQSPACNSPYTCIQHIALDHVLNAFVLHAFTMHTAIWLAYICLNAHSCPAPFLPLPLTVICPYPCSPHSFTQQTALDFVPICISAPYLRPVDAYTPPPPHPSRLFIIDAFDWDLWIEWRRVWVGGLWHSPELWLASHDVMSHLNGVCTDSGIARASADSLYQYDTRSSPL